VNAEDLTVAARALRSRQTSAEKRLWAGLRRKSLEAFRFRRQVPLCGFIVDFACFEARLIVEVDGATHSSDDERVRDDKRDAILRANGNTVLRFGNVEVYENLDGVLETIRLKLLELCPEGSNKFTPRPPIPSPLVGEG
jgi:very-short-patch-repair endonuclease